MSRKLQKAIWRDGEIRRRSPRISALDAFKSSDDQRQQQELQSRMKRKLDDDAALTPSTSKLAKQVWKGKDSTQQNDDHASKCVDWRSRVVQENKKLHEHSAILNGKASVMPAKHILELVLDTLQRRDTYEIFAEPVDPDEVDDYYEIIKEPMDFGTMRAKLHERMYENLEQFEHDVFLIPENAMHFNSSTTIYFRQARAIHELAKKVFHSLKTDPENFELEFSGTRRRSMRKALCDTKDSRSNVEVSLKGKLDSSSTFIRRTTKKNPAFTDYFHSRNILTGNRFISLSSSDNIEDRRRTYVTWRSSAYNLHEDSVGSTLYTSSKPLLMINQGDISYEYSLLRFAKDLGPIAQKVAKRKLLGHHESISQKFPISETAQINCNVNDGLNTTTSLQTFRDFASHHRPFAKTTANNIIDLTKDVEEATNGRERVKEPTLKPREGSSNVPNIEKKTFKNTEMIRSRKIDDNNVQRPVILALENPRQSNVSEFKGKSNKKSLPSLPWSGVAKDKGPAAPPAPVPFTFDIPFLKEKLSQMNQRSGGDPASIENVGIMNNCTRQAQSISEGSNCLLYNQKSLSNKLDTNLALQL